MHLPGERPANAACSSSNLNRRADNHAAGTKMEMTECPLLMPHPPRKQLLRIGKDERQIGRIAGAIHELVGIGGKIEEERRQAGEMDVFVAPVTNDREAAFIRIEAERRLRA